MKSRERRRRRRKRRGESGHALEAALQLHRAGRLPEAERAYRQLLRIDPECLPALHLLGRLAHSRGRTEEAIGFLEQLLELQPGDVAALNDLGNLLREAGKLEKAAAVFRDLLRRQPRDAVARINLGVVLQDQGRSSEAEAAYRQAISDHPSYAEAHASLGNLLKRQGELAQAAQAYRRAIELNPEDVKTYRNLVATLRRQDKPDEAREMLRRWRRHLPDDPVAQHMLAAMSDEATPSRASDRYVRRVFDQFAATFDKDLKELGYRGPQVIANAVTSVLGDAAADLDVVDAGCGTGLCAARLRPFARRLVGVDLSPEMLKRARRLGIYDELVESELTDHLCRSPAAYDLIVSADTLQYFGDLRPVAAAAAGALRNRGVIVFTLEQGDADAAEPGYRLKAHGRYVHSENFLRRCLEEVHLPVRSITTSRLRTEAGKPVAAMVAVARKAPT
jgi:predicted TPR repeat methyltransferase